MPSRSTDEKLFLNWMYPFEVLQARCTIIEDLVRYIGKGVDDPYDPSKRHPQWRAFEADVRARLYETFRPLMKRQSKTPAGVEGDTREILFYAFDEGMANCSIDRLKAIPHFRDEGLISDFGKKFYARVIPSYHEADPSVDGAYNQSLDNFHQTEGRLAALHALYFLLRTNHHGNIAELLGFEEIRRTLFERRDQFMRYIAMFGGLLGGAKAAAAVQLLALESCHKEHSDYVQYSIIQFLQADGVVPGRWLGESDEKFRNDIKRRFDALKEIE